jgi:Ca2+-binding RTX toxin-like protein
VAIDTGIGDTDLVRATVSFTLGAGIENLEMLGGSVSGTGNAEDNLITGNGLNNILIGLGGEDTLNGGASNDRLEGGVDEDRLVGGTGADTVDGGAGEDVIVLNPVGIDRIVNFARGDDSLEAAASLFGGLPLGVLAASRYTENLLGLATTADHRFIFETDTQILYYDSNGNASGGRVAIAAFRDAAGAIVPGFSLDSSDIFIA